MQGMANRFVKSVQRGTATIFMKVYKKDGKIYYEYPSVNIQINKINPAKSIVILDGFIACTSAFNATGTYPYPPILSGLTDTNIFLDKSVRAASNLDKSNYSGFADYDSNALLNNGPAIEVENHTKFSWQVIEFY